MEVKPLIYAMENTHGIVKDDDYIQRIGDHSPH